MFEHFILMCVCWLFTIYYFVVSSKVVYLRNGESVHADGYDYSRWISLAATLYLTGKFIYTYG